MSVEQGVVIVDTVRQTDTIWEIEPDGNSGWPSAPIRRRLRTRYRYTEVVPRWGAQPASQLICVHRTEALRIVRLPGTVEHGEQALCTHATSRIEFRDLRQRLAAL